MLDFMDYIQLAFADACHWDCSNSYSSLADTARALLDFSIPQRLKINLSSLSTPQFATTYTLGTIGLIDGSISYLFSSVPLDDTPSRSSLLPLRSLVPGYRQVQPPTALLRNAGHYGGSTAPNGVHGQKRDSERKATLAYATLHLPSPTMLTALYLRQVSPNTKISVALASMRGMPLYKEPQASVLMQVFHNTPKYGTELLFSSDSALLGFKGLWNFSPLASPRNRDVGRSFFSAGGEVYYSPISSMVGLSTGLRFTTIPSFGKSSSPSLSSTSAAASTPSPIPYTLTLTLAPITGSLSTTYSILASENLALSSRFSFNVYSWESEMVAGCELWRRKSAQAPVQKVQEEIHEREKKEAERQRFIDQVHWARHDRRLGLSPVSFHQTYPMALVTDADERKSAAPFASEATHTAAPTSSLPSAPAPPSASSPSYAASSNGDSVMKLCIDQSWNLRLLWEGKVKELLVSAGVGVGTLPQTDRTDTIAASPFKVDHNKRSFGWTGVGMSITYSS